MGIQWMNFQFIGDLRWPVITQYLTCTSHHADQTPTLAQWLAVCPVAVCSVTVNTHHPRGAGRFVARTLIPRHVKPQV